MAKVNFQHLKNQESRLTALASEFAREGRASFKRDELGTIVAEEHSANFLKVVFKVTKERAQEIHAALYGDDVGDKIALTAIEAINGKLLSQADIDRINQINLVAPSLTEILGGVEPTAILPCAERTPTISQSRALPERTQNQFMASVEKALGKGTALADIKVGLPTQSMVFVRDYTSKQLSEILPKSDIEAGELKIIVENNLARNPVFMKVNVQTAYALGLFSGECLDKVTALLSTEPKAEPVHQQSFTSVLNEPPVIEPDTGLEETVTAESIEAISTVDHSLKIERNYFFGPLSAAGIVPNINEIPESHIKAVNQAQHDILFGQHNPPTPSKQDALDALMDHMLGADLGEGETLLNNVDDLVEEYNALFAEHTWV